MGFHCQFLRNVHDKMVDGKTACEKMFGVTFEVLLIPFGFNVSYKPMSLGIEAVLTNASGNLHGMCIRCGRGWSGDLLIAECEDLDNLSASNIHVRRFKHQELAQEGTLSLPSADGSHKLFDLLRLHRGEKANCTKRRAKCKRSGRETLRRRNGKYWSMGGDFKYRRHEVHRSTLYVPNEETFSIQLM